MGCDVDVRRRLAVVTIAATFAIAVPATAAMAAGTGVITSPAAEATVDSGVPIEVQVTGNTGLFGPNHQVQVRLADLAQQPLSEPVALNCLSGGDSCRADSTWGGQTFNPTNLAPFAVTAPACNGGYHLQVRVDGGNWTGHRVRVAAAPAAPSGVKVTAGTETATISWTLAGHPDITGHHIQRRAAGGDWATVGTVAGSATSWTDSDAPAGDLEYRVATMRGDGAAADGSPVAPCSDTGTDLATFSDAVPTTVRAAQASGDSGGGSTSGPSRPRPTTQSPDADGGDTGGESPSEGASDGDSAPDGGAGAEDPTDPEASEAPRVERRAGSRVAPPAPIEQSMRGDVTVPRTEVSSPDAPRVAEERYYGEDDEFSEDLPFAEAAGSGSGPAPTTETRTIRVPGALQSVLGEEVDLARVIQPIAGGLLLLTIALHLRRWIREGATVS